jgi:peptidoglycan/xylan/chitin deacetylase (PgdA/CDA1 family)
VNARWMRWLLSLGLPARPTRTGPPRLTIVRHHRVYAEAERALYPLGVTESVLAGQLEACVRAGLAPVTVREGLERLARGDAGTALAFSFDDGYADNVARALPLLQRHGARATFYLAAGLMEERRAPWWDELAFVLEHATRSAPRVEVGGAPLALELATHAGRVAALRALLPLLRVPPGEQRIRLDRLRAAAGVTASAPCELAEWPFARRLSDAGMELGAHTLSHPFLSLLPEAEQRREIAESAALITSRTGAEVVGLAYPNGDHDAATVRAAQASGLAHAVVTTSGDCGPASPRFTLPRRPLPQGACTGPFGFSARMTMAEVHGAFDRLRGRAVGASS